MLVLAYRLMNNCPDSYLKQVMDIFSQTALEICEGQQWDMEFETRSDVTVSEYIEMIRLKTSVLLSAALKRFISCRSELSSSGYIDFVASGGNISSLQ